MALPSEYVSLEGVCASIKARNPRLLCALAEKLEAVLDPLSVFTPGTLYVHGAASDSSGVTYRDLASYFRSAAERHVPVLFQTPYQAFEAQTVRIFRDWISSQVRDLEAEAVQALFAESSMSARGSAQILKLGNGAFTAAYEDQPKQMNASGHDHLLRKLAIQNDQRKAQEAASQDAIARREAEHRAMRAEINLAAKEEELRQQLEKNAEYERHRNEDRRTIRALQDELVSLEEQMKDVAGLMEFCDPQNPLSPPEGRLLVRCWMEMTHNGTYDVVSESRVGMKENARRWLKSVDGQEPAAARLKIYSLLLTSAARKSGGVLASTSKKRYPLQRP